MNHRPRTFLVGFWVAAALCTQGRSSEAGPPNVPVSFDRPAVAHLIGNVEQGSNASILKVAYFASRKPHPCAGSDALGMLADAIRAEPDGSKRRLVLESVYAFGCFRVGSVSLDPGLAMYEHIFAPQSGYLRVDAAKVVGAAMQDCLGALAGMEMAPKWFERKTQLLLLVARAYVEHPEIPFADLDFGRAMEWGVDIDRVARCIHKALDGQPGRSYTTLKRAAVVLEAVRPEESLSLLESAKPLLSEKDAEEVERFYRHYVGRLTAARRFDEAAAAQARATKLTGTGAASLMVLKYRKGDRAAVTEGIHALAYVTVDEKELRDLVDLLIEEKQLGVAEFALRSYLAAPRRRVSGPDLWARYTLASLLVQEAHVAEAREVAGSPWTEAELDTPMARIYYRRLKDLRTRLSRP